MSQATSPSNTESRLTSVCTELFAFALTLRTAQDPGDSDRLFETMGKLLERMSHRARDAGVDSAHLEAARYAICALLDEIVLGSRWAIKQQWMDKPLQMAFFGDFTAGEQFYQRLETLRSDPQHNLEAIEVYTQCLAAGFRGKYGDLAGMQKIDDMLADLNREIRSVRGIEGRSLSKPFMRSEVLPQKVRRIPAWIVAAGGAGLLLLVLFVLDALLASQASDFLASGGSGR